MGWKFALIPKIVLTTAYFFCAIFFCKLSVSSNHVKFYHSNIILELCVQALVLRVTCEPLFIILKTIEKWITSTVSRIPIHLLCISYCHLKEGPLSEIYLFLSGRKSNKSEKRKNFSHICVQSLVPWVKMTKMSGSRRVRIQKIDWFFCTYAELRSGIEIIIRIM